MVVRWSLPSTTPIPGLFPVENRRSLVSLHNGIRDEHSSDLLTPEPTTIQALYSLFSALDGVKLNVYFSLSLLFHLDKFNFAVLGLALPLDVICELFVPIRITFP
jgi:hypothetical protein